MPRPSVHTPPVTSPPTGQLEPFQVKSKTSLFQSIKEGFGFGVGTSLAHKVFGPSAPEHPQTATAQPASHAPPSQEKQKTVSIDHVYNQCILEGGTESFCRELSDILK
jgi:hypothetical protein